MQVVFHINEVDRWDMVLSNVKNFLAEVAEAKITIVANGSAVKYYLEDNIPQETFKDVDVVACQNSLRNQEISKEQLNPLIRIVDSGVVELANKQAEGYAYIRP